MLSIIIIIFFLLEGTYLISMIQLSADVQAVRLRFLLLLWFIPFLFFLLFALFLRLQPLHSNINVVNTIDFDTQLLEKIRYG